MSKSSGSPASRSKARARFPLFSRSTSSSPRRKISTSLLLSRNCLGKRTAWLFPERKTLAVGIDLRFSNKYIHIVYQQTSTRQIKRALAAGNWSDSLFRKELRHVAEFVVARGNQIADGEGL